MALLGPSAADFPEDNKRVMLSLAAVIEPRLWTAPRVIGVGPLIRGEGALLHALTSDIADRTNLVPYGGPVRRASTDQLRSVRFKAHQLKAALRDLPPEVREDYGMALRTDLDKDFIPKLERLEVQARLWERGEVRSGVFTSKGLKSYLEERIAYTLVLHGVPLGGNGERFGSGPKHSEDLTARGTLRCR